MQPARYLVFGFALLAVPAVWLVLGMAFEVLDGNIRGVQRIIELAVLIAVAAAAWRWPFAVGQLLMVGAALLAVAFVLFLHSADATLIGILLVEIVVFLPLILGGALFTLAGALQQRDKAAT